MRFARAGKGFVVETPYGEITDQGTEFGIDLTEKGQAGLVVFEGAVDLRVAEAFRYVDYETGLRPGTPPEAVETESW